MEHKGWVWQGWEGIWPWVAGGIALAALVALIYSYRQATTHPSRKLAGWACKIAVFILLLLALLEPMSVTQTAKKGENDVLILADDSASLGLKDPATGKPVGLIPGVEAGAAAPAGWWKQLEDVFRVQGFSFDDRLHDRADLGTRTFGATRSALVTSLEALLKRFEKQPVAAVVVFTDGNATDAAKLETLLASKPGVPIFPVVQGLKEAPKDLALQNVDVTQTPFEDSPVAVSARVSARGFEKEELSLVVRDEAGKVVVTEKHLLPAGGVDHVFQARFRPAKTGLSFYNVMVVRSAAAGALDDETKLTAAAGETTLENNRRTIAVDRKTGPYRVLYVGGRPNWEYKFMRRALELDNEVKLVSLIRMARREPKFQWRGREGETSNPLFRGFRGEGQEEAQRYDQPVLVRLGISDKKELADGFPRTPEELFGSFRAVILDDVEAEFFSQEQMDLLEKFVSVRGGSLLMLGGQESFRLGKYDHTPVGRMLPVYLDAAGSGPAGPVQEAAFNLTREGWLEPWMRLRSVEGDEESRLANMPPFFSVNQTTAIKPGASVLATVTDGARKSHPAWVVQRYGNGRVAAVMVGDVWRWGMRDPESHTDMDKAWRQMLRWLVVDVTDRVDLAVPVTAGGSHELVTPQVRVRDKAFRPQDDASVKVEIAEPDGTKLNLAAEPSSAEAGLFEAASHASRAGAYRVKTTVQDSTGAVLGESTTGWALNPAAAEFASLTPNRPLLEKIAQWSGGRVLQPEELDAWAAELPQSAMPMMEIRSEPLWNQWWLLLLVVALLGTEWWMRRRQGWR